VPTAGIPGFPPLHRYPCGGGLGAVARGTPVADHEGAPMLANERFVVEYEGKKRRMLMGIETRANLLNSACRPRNRSPRLGGIQQQ